MANRYEIDEEQIKRLKNIAIAMRADNVTSEIAAPFGYEIEQVIAECENAPIADDEATYGKSDEDDDEPDNNGGSTEEEL